MKTPLTPVSLRGGATAMATNIKKAQERAELLCEIADETCLDQVHNSDVVKLNFEGQKATRHTGIDNPPILAIDHLTDAQGSKERVFETFIRGKNGNTHYHQHREVDGVEVSGVSYVLEEKTGLLVSSTLTGRNFHNLPENKKLEGLSTEDKRELWNFCDSRT